MTDSARTGRRWRGRRGGASLIVVLAGPVLTQTALLHSAAALEPDRTGWWSTLGDATVATTTAPDIPAGGLLVQGGTTETAPTAFAAMSYAVSDTLRVSKLVVGVTGASTPGAVLQACRLTESFVPAQGAPMADAPAFDCGGAVRAKVNAEGTQMSFAVASLVRDGSLDVALLPTASTDRVVLARPVADSLVTTPALPAAPAAPAPGAPAGGTPPVTSTPGGVATGTGSGFAPSVDLPGTSTPGQPTTAAPEVAPSGQAPAQPAQPATLPVAVTDDDSSRPLTILGAGLALLVVVLWTMAGRSAARPVPVKGPEGVA